MNTALGDEMNRLSRVTFGVQQLALNNPNVLPVVMVNWHDDDVARTEKQRFALFMVSPDTVISVSEKAVVHMLVSASC